MALLVLGGVLLAGQSRPAAAANHAASGYAMLIASVVAFLLLAPCQPGGTIPDPALRPPRAAI
ncbi:MAG: hypothetical protein LGL72_02360 [Acidibrevibacterium sp.]|uniref:hypothetical protein n=1 Tax=Acidibrevibacterium fodinaquatile TaxID=1969806 RepID=UPI0023A85D1D|nr:hypothetical protein [Acidibrevibacterium fodinaquatile]MCA7118262.1 hypothetical protein [Acidibrevibacterium fodinaquatile]